MNGLEALEKLCQLACDDRDKLYYLQHRNCKEAEENIEFKPYCNGCPYCGGKLKKSIEKELKALEIIKNKRVQVEYLAFIVHDYKYCATEEQVELYNKKCARWNVLTKDEFDLLKEVLQ